MAAEKKKAAKRKLKEQHLEKQLRQQKQAKQEQQQQRQQQLARQQQQQQQQRAQKQQKVDLTADGADEGRGSPAISPLGSARKFATSMPNPSSKTKPSAVVYRSLKLYQPTFDGAISMAAGELVELKGGEAGKRQELDTKALWTYVKKLADGAEGYVPTTFLEHSPYA